MAGTTMTIRLATVLDFEAISAADPAAQRDPARPAFLRSHIEGGRCWVAESQDGVAGFLVLEYTFRPGLRAAPGGARGCETPRRRTRTPRTRHVRLHDRQALHLDEGDPELVFFRRLR
jgi:hypothetical protein